jgi:SAM-dependent methyltransferase
MAARCLVHDRALYSRMARYYDRIYWSKDYGREVDFLVELLRRRGVTGRRVLEVGCGTGNHTRLLVARGYRVTGVDLSGDILRIAEEKVRHGAVFARADMRDLDRAVEGEYDAVVCLFSTVSYNRTLRDLRKTLSGFHGRLAPGGVVAFDTHFTKSGFLDGYRGEDVFDDGEVIGARLSISKRRGDVGELRFTYLIKDGRKVTVLRNDVHRLGLFDPEEILRTMRDVGFVRVGTYTDWTLARRTPGDVFRDRIFVGSRRVG